MTPRAVISAIIEKIDNGERKVFLQTRWKPQTSPTYSGLLEIPAGGVDSYENVYDALSREVEEETGLKIIAIIDDYRSDVLENRPHDKSMVFRPFICQQSLETNEGLPWIGFVFRCRVEGEPVLDEREAKDPQWITIGELDALLQSKPEMFFSLQYATLRYYVDFIKSLSTTS
jgi:8-oxo-dGTP pyrophosphatase MutT (NUDIX family)